MKFIIVVPTYWGPPLGVDLATADTSYDHPTPVDGASTLPRLLESLCQQQKQEFFTLIITAGVSEEWAERGSARVEELIRPFRGRLAIAQANGKILSLLQTALHAGGEDGQCLSLRGYGNVRNIQLLLPYALGAQAVIALDDDEVVDPDYVSRAVQFIGQDGIWGIGGPYLDAGGSSFLIEERKTGNPLLDKAWWMNETLRNLVAASEEFPVTPMAFGGNMVFHRKLVAQVPFDPGVGRGEDVDYLINAKLRGFAFRMDRKLTITHLPPREYQISPLRKMREDVMRFFYERAKLRRAGMHPESFAPYPGCLLREDLEQHALEGLRIAATPEDMERFGSPSSIVAHSAARTDAALDAYQLLTERWPRLLKAVEESSASLWRALGTVPR